MSFFQLSDGNNVNTNGTMEMGGGDLPPIPANTNVLAAIDEAKIDGYEGNRFIKLRWTILQPEQFKNRKIFQKVHAYDTDTNKRDKAIRMLAAIDANCGGKLVASGQEPNDQNLTAALLNRPMVLNLQVWETEDKTKSGNWVSKVSPRQQAAAPAPAAAPMTPPVADPNETIPF